MFMVLPIRRFDTATSSLSAAAKSNGPAIMPWERRSDEIMIKLRHVKRYLSGEKSEDLWLNPRHIMAVYPARDEERSSIKSTVLINGYSFAVEEAPDEIASFIPFPSAQ
jgi:hypothetical protein